MKIGLFYKNITVLDYAFVDHHKGIVGDSLKVNIELIGHTDCEGVVFDFSLAKKKIKEIIDLECDHRLIVPNHLVTIKENMAYLDLEYGNLSKKVSYKAPVESICAIPSHHVDRAGIQCFLENLLMPFMPENVDAIKISFEEEENKDNNHQFFHYSHGLKDHYGNCQRLFHGHRSTLEVFLDGQRSYDLESWLAKEVFSSNIHFVMESNIRNLEEIKKSAKSESLEGRYFGLPQLEIEYTSKQGNYWASIPISMAYIIKEETTVENLSLHFLKLVKKKTGKENGLQVNAFEGIGKGATSHQ